MKNTCLALLATLDNPEIHELLRAQIDTGAVATDRISAFSLYMNSTAPDRLAVLETFSASAASHPVSWEAYLSAVGRCSAPDAISLIRMAGKSPFFDISQVNDHRALYGTFAANRKISLQTPGGRDLLGEILRDLAPINQNSVVSLLQAFDSIDLMEEKYYEPLIGLLISFQNSLDPGSQVVVLHTIRRLLLGAPKAVSAWESVHKK